MDAPIITTLMLSAKEWSPFLMIQYEGEATMVIQYNKLVRDRIPEIIESSGKTCATEILSDEDYIRMIDVKLD
jgi:hypothetical protein